MINELIQQLQQKAGLSSDQANTALQTIKQYVVEKFPMLAGAVDNIFPSGAAPVSNPESKAAATNAGANVGAAANQATPAAGGAAPQQEGSFLDKISDYIPGQAGQSIEDFAKKAAGNAGDFFNKK